MRSLQPNFHLCVLITISILLGGAINAQEKPSSASSEAPVIPARITHAVDEKNLVVLKVIVRQLARPKYDQGDAPLDLPIERMLLVLKRSPEQEDALKKL